MNSLPQAATREVESILSRFPCQCPFSHFFRIVFQGPIKAGHFSFHEISWNSNKNVFFHLITSDRKVFQSLVVAPMQMTSLEDGWAKDNKLCNFGLWPSSPNTASTLGDGQCYSLGLCLGICSMAQPGWGTILSLLLEASQPLWGARGRGRCQVAWCVFGCRVCRQSCVRIWRVRVWVAGIPRLDLLQLLLPSEPRSTTMLDPILWELGFVRGHPY